MFGVKDLSCNIYGLVFNIGVMVFWDFGIGLGLRARVMDRFRVRIRFKDRARVKV